MQVQPEKEATAEEAVSPDPERQRALASEEAERLWRTCRHQFRDFALKKIIGTLLTWSREAERREREACARVAELWERLDITVWSVSRGQVSHAIRARADALEAEGGRKTDTPELFYIQHVGFCGNCLFWWRPDGHGYTSTLDEAWKVTKEKAEDICRVRRGEDVAWPVAKADAMAQRHVAVG